MISGRLFFLCGTVLAVAIATASGCGGSSGTGVASPDGGVPDGGVPDGGVPDGGVPDGGVPDGGVPDGGVPDGGVPDAGIPDGGMPDSGVPDGGMPDGGVLVSFAQDIQPIFDSRCTNCHNGTLLRGQLNLTSPGAYSQLVDVPTSPSCSAVVPDVPRVKPGDKEGSMLWRKTK